MNKILIFLLILTFVNCSGVDSKFSKTENLLAFHTDDDYLLLYILANTKANRISNKDYTADIMSFQNKVWKEDRDEYEHFLTQNKNFYPISYLSFKKYYESDNASLIRKYKGSNEFKILKDQNDDYKKTVEELWSKQFLETKSIVSSLTGLTLDKNQIVIITHPGIKNGRELSGEWIEWGGYADPQYILTSLWHENLHNYLDRSNLSHSVIELIADNQLNKELTKSDYPPLRGHSQLDPIKNCLLPEWKKYLESKSKNIQDFIKIKKVAECEKLFKNLNW